MLVHAALSSLPGAPTELAAPAPPVTQGEQNGETKRGDLAERPRLLGEGEQGAGGPAGLPGPAWRNLSPGPAAGGAVCTSEQEAGGEVRVHRLSGCTSGQVPSRSGGVFTCLLSQVAQTARIRPPSTAPPERRGEPPPRQAAAAEFSCVKALPFPFSPFLFFPPREGEETLGGG